MTITPEMIVPDPSLASGFRIGYPGRLKERLYA